MLLSTVLRFINAVLILLLLARVWGPELFGFFMYPFTLAGILVILVDYGFNLQLVRDVGKKPQEVHRLTCQAITIKSLLAIIVVAVGLPFILLLESLDGYRLILVLLLLANIFNSYGLVYNLSFRGMGRFDKEVGTMFWLTIVTVLLLGPLIILKQSPEVIALALVAAKAVFMAHSWVVYRRVADGSRFIWPSVHSSFVALKTGFPFAAHVALGVLYFSVDTIIIQHFLGPENVGVYQAGLRVMLGCLILADVLANVYLSRMARESSDRPAMIKLATSMTRHFLVVGLLGFIFIIGFSELIVKVIYGLNGYSKVVSLLPLFGVVLFIRCMGISYGVVLTVDHRQTLRMVAAGLSVLISIGMNLYLIPKFALPGALFASIVTHVFLVGVYVYFTWRQVESCLIDWRGWILLALVFVVVLIQLWVLQPSTNVTYAVVIGAVLITGFTGVTSVEFSSLVSRLQRALPRMA